MNDWVGVWVDAGCARAGLRRGAGVPIIVPLPYYYDDIRDAIARLQPKHLILCGTVIPYAAFGCESSERADPDPAYD
eukprot:COSAG05_NODE_3228_length_2223_cov_3.104520_3_plen_77_part_00